MDKQNRARRGRLAALVAEHRADGITVAAPMVRYSKLAFRALVRRYRTHLVYSPMICADAFVVSQEAQQVEFTTNAEDSPLVVQFAAENPVDFGRASLLVAPYVDAVDLNCGCPQGWALRHGYGCSLMFRPAVLADMVRQAWNQSGVDVSVKLRVFRDDRRTVELARALEAAGVALLAVHGRVLGQSSKTPPNWSAVRLAKQSVAVPVIANGSVFRPADVQPILAATGADGVMAARGLLRNPALFAGYETLPLQCAADYLSLAIRLGVPFHTIKAHVGFMAENGVLTDRRSLYGIHSTVGMTRFLSDRGVSVPVRFDRAEAPIGPAALALRRCNPPIDPTVVAT